MTPYPKIQSVFKRDPTTKYKTLLLGEYATPEFEYLKNNTWVFTEKVDGMNIRIMHDGCGSLRYAGRTDRAQIPFKLAERLSELFLPQWDTIVELFPKGVCFYGEGYGAKIQKGGGNYSSTQDFVLFDVKIGRWWLQRSDVSEIAAKLGLSIVPVESAGTLDDMVRLVKEGFISYWGDFPMEGLVARPKVELVSRNGERIITKLKTKDFQ